ncbi:hypothetical protein EON66_05165 [archaeon]|nr:MAG: hypothetical protein EON66_05165 [archaeon]
MSGTPTASSTKSRSASPSGTPPGTPFSSVSSTSIPRTGTTTGSPSQSVTSSPSISNSAVPVVPSDITASTSTTSATSPLTHSASSSPHVTATSSMRSNPSASSSSSSSSSSVVQGNASSSPSTGASSHGSPSPSTSSSVDAANQTAHATGSVSPTAIAALVSSTATASASSTPSPSAQFMLPASIVEALVPGTWVSTLDPQTVVACQPPSTVRCAGYNASSQQVQCAAGYMGWGCLVCAPGYYATMDSRCARCNAGSTDWNSLLMPVAYMLAATLAVGALTYLGISVARKLYGGSTAGGVRRTLQFTVWSIAVFQLLAQTARAAAPGLPTALEAFFKILAYTQFDMGSSSHPACVQGVSPWLFDYVVLGVGIALASVILLLVSAEATIRAATARCARGRHGAQGDASADTCGTRFLGRMLKIGFLASSLLYSVIANTAIRALHCSTIRINVSGYLSLASDGTALADAAAARGADANDAAFLTHAMDVQVLASNPYVVCWEAEHRTVASLAVAALVLFVLALPLMSTAFVWLRTRSIAASGASAALWQALKERQPSIDTAYVEEYGKHAPCMHCALCGKTIRRCRLRLCGLPYQPARESHSSTTPTAGAADRRKSLSLNEDSAHVHAHNRKADASEVRQASVAASKQNQRRLSVDKLLAGAVHAQRAAQLRANNTASALRDFLPPVPVAHDTSPSASTSKRRSSVLLTAACKSCWTPTRSCCSTPRLRTLQPTTTAHPGFIFVSLIRPFSCGLRGHWSCSRLQHPHYRQS